MIFSLTSYSRDCTNMKIYLVVLVAIYIFVIVYSATWSIVFQIYSSEIQPPKTRAAASSLAQSANWVCDQPQFRKVIPADFSKIVNWVVAFTTPLMLAQSSFGAYFLFGFSTLFTVVVCMVFMPETRSNSLEQIEDAFNGSLARQVKRSSGIYGPNAIELQGRPDLQRRPSELHRRPSFRPSVRAPSPKLSDHDDVENLDTRVMGPARALRVMPSVESIRKWLLRWTNASFVGFHTR